MACGGFIVRVINWLVEERKVRAFEFGGCDFIEAVVAWQPDWQCWMHFVPFMSSCWANLSMTSRSAFYNFYAKYTRMSGTYTWRNFHQIRTSKQMNLSKNSFMKAECMFSLVRDVLKWRKLGFKFKTFKCMSLCLTFIQNCRLSWKLKYPRLGSIFSTNVLSF